MCLYLRFLVFLFFTCIFSAGPAFAENDQRLDHIAEAYVKLTLAIAQHDPGYLDAYYGPDKWQTDAKNNIRSINQLQTNALDLLGEIKEIGIPAKSPLLKRRQSFLESQLKAAVAKLQMLDGQEFLYLDEAEKLYGLRPDLKPLSTYDPILKRLEEVVPGAGPLPERVAALRARFAVPVDQLETVMRRSIDECRTRTAQHIKLPGGENFKLEIVSGKPWAAYNWYLGQSQSLIELNTDYPLTVERILELACHEGYPGHHLHNSLLEQELVQKRQWQEFTIYPLNSPFFFLAEGLGNYVPELVFPAEERITFLNKTLLPLTGLNETDTAPLVRMTSALKTLSTATMKITADYLDGRIDKNIAVGQLQKYALLTLAQAEQSVSLMKHYRSYGVNYSLGEQVIRVHIDLKGSSEDKKWQTVKALLAQPWVPADLISEHKN